MGVYQLGKCFCWGMCFWAVGRDGIESKTCVQRSNVLLSRAALLCVLCASRSVFGTLSSLEHQNAEDWLLAWDASRLTCGHLLRKILPMIPGQMQKNKSDAEEQIQGYQFMVEVQSPLIGLLQWVAVGCPFAWQKCWTFIYCCQWMPYWLSWMGLFGHISVKPSMLFGSWSLSPALNSSFQIQWTIKAVFLGSPGRQSNRK